MTGKLFFHVLRLLGLDLCTSRSTPDSASDKRDNSNPAIEAEGHRPDSGKRAPSQRMIAENAGDRVAPQRARGHEVVIPQIRRALPQELEQKREHCRVHLRAQGGLGDIETLTEARKM